MNTLEERPAVMWDLSREAWSLTGRQIASQESRIYQ